MSVELIFLIIIAGIVALNILGLFIILIVNGAKKPKHKKAKKQKKLKEKTKKKAKEETKEKEKEKGEIVMAKKKKEKTEVIVNEGESRFDGRLLQLWGWTLLCALITAVSFGICYPWALCLMKKWETKHMIVDGRRLVF